MAIPELQLPYAMDALEPHISKETFEYHYGKHYKAYLTKLNDAIAGTAQENSSLEEIVKSSSGGLFNNAAQVWNHEFYWKGFKPNGGGEPSGKIGESINASFESFAQFKEAFSTSAATNFGSGWTWLVQKNDGSLAIENTSNAATPIKDGTRVLLTIDVWEHAYYVDYRNARPQYIEAFWNLVNWDFVESNMA